MPLKVERANPKDILFSQDTISPFFSDGGRIDDAIRVLRKGDLKPDSFPPIRIVEHQGKWWSLDNRRLTVFKAAQMEDLPFVQLSLGDPNVRDTFFNRFRPIAGGRMIIVVTSKERPAAIKLLREHGKYSTD